MFSAVLRYGRDKKWTSGSVMEKTLGKKYHRLSPEGCIYQDKGKLEIDCWKTQLWFMSVPYWIELVWPYSNCLQEAKVNLFLKSRKLSLASSYLCSFHIQFLALNTNYQAYQERGPNDYTPKERKQKSEDNL